MPLDRLRALPARARLYRDDRSLSPLAREVRRQHLTYLVPLKLRNIEWALDEVGAVPGCFIETGVALGGSAILIARHLTAHRSFHGYDVFGMIPPPSDRDPELVHQRYATIASGQSLGIAHEPYYGYRPDLIAEVRRSFAAFNVPVDDSRVCLHEGLFEDTLHPPGAVAFAHIDCDWYEPVMLSLERIYPHLSPGAILISDDYYDYGGARDAVDEFVARHQDLQRIPGRGRHLLLRRA